jgi:hypothetical protein
MLIRYLTRLYDSVISRGYIEIEQLEGQLEIEELIASLRRQGVNDELIATAIAEAGAAYAIQ